MTKEHNTYSILNSLAIFFILSNAILYLDTIPILRWGFSGLRVLAVAYAFLVAFPHLRFGKFTVYVGLFYMVAGLTTILHSGSIHTWLAYTLNSLGIVLLLYLSLLQSPKHTIRILALFFDVFIYLNFFLTLLFPDGIFEGSYLLGLNRNSVGPSLLCGLIIHYYAYRMHDRSWVTFVLLGAISIATTIIIESMTSAVGCSLLTAFFFVPTKKLRKIILIVFLTFYLVFQAFVVYLQGDLSSNKRAVFFIEEILQKDMTFTNRVYVWSDSYELIQRSPVTGYGMQDSEWFDEQIHVKSAHNIMYQVLILGGYILLFIFLFIVLKSIIRAKNQASELTLFALFSVCTLFFMMTMEAYNFVIIFLILALTYYSFEFSKAIDIDTDNEA